MYCNHCGKEVNDDAVVCPNCGCALAGKPTEIDKPNTGFGVLSFFFPLIGFILWLLWRDKLPLKAKSCGKGALIGVVVSVVISVLSIIVSCAMIAAVDATISGITFGL